MNAVAVVDALAAWKPIDAIPGTLKDGRPVLLCAGRPTMGRWLMGDWRDGDWSNGRWVDEAHYTIHPTDYADIEGPLQ